MYMYMYVLIHSVHRKKYYMWKNLSKQAPVIWHFQVIATPSKQEF